MASIDTNSVTNRTAGQDADGSAAASAQWWRTVLGEYPTGVTLITAFDHDGELTGMVVGTFTAVSEDPPMVSFMPALASSSYAKIAGSTRFAASVLGSSHEDLCRAFARRDPDRLRHADFAMTTNGLPRLKDAVAWFEGTVNNTVVVGDHAVVFADVTEFGVGDAGSGLPLIYLKGGYGSFTVPSLQFDLHEFGEQLRLVDAMRPVISEFAQRAGVECVLSTVVRDSLVTLAVANLRSQPGLSGLLGTSFPFAAPISPVMAAWSSPERTKLWVENTRHLLGKVDRGSLEHTLELVRERGYAASLGATISEAFDITLLDPQTSPSDVAELWAKVDNEHKSLLESDEWFREVSSLQVPIFDAEGHAVIELAISGFGPGLAEHQLATLENEAIAIAARLTAIVGGATPPGYPAR